MVNSDVDGDTKILNHWNILGNTQKNNNLLKTKIIVKPNTVQAKWGVGFYIYSPSVPPSVTPLQTSMFAS